MTLAEWGFRPRRDGLLFDGARDPMGTAMTVFDEGLPSRPSRMPHRRGVPALSNVWTWVVRLVLPVVLYLAGQVLYWIWIDNVYAHNWTSIVGGVWIAFTMAMIALWLLCVWISTEEP